MKYLVAKNKKHRRNYRLIEKKKVFLKSLNKNKFLLNKYRKFVNIKLLKICCYRSFIKNYCVITGRSRGIVQKFGISRMIFKYYASFGYLKGIKKSSW